MYIKWLIELFIINLFIYYYVIIYLFIIILYFGYIQAKVMWIDCSRTVFAGAGDECNKSLFLEYFICSCLH